MAPKALITYLWFNGQAEEAANLYTSIFDNSKIGKKNYYLEAGKENHGHEAGTLMSIEFELNGQKFVGLNGGPEFKHSEAISFQIPCDNQDEVDYYWDKLGEGGNEARRMCGWTADKFGIAWQVVPTVLLGMLANEDREAAGRATNAMMAMKKLDIRGLEAAFKGN
ncbi:hypothetical protein HJFPF1_02399 [Paramyrothecium foliicola]|nr:hypothetical protein HJFPF1_02399 [Paramyrothecium foliicola]